MDLYPQVVIQANLIPDLLSEATQLAQQAVDECCENVIAYAEPAVPVDTGFLRDSATIIEDGPLVSYVTWTAPYAIYQNDGTRYIDGNFFAELGAARAKPEFEAAMAEIFKL